MRLRISCFVLFAVCSISLAADTITVVSGSNAVFSAIAHSQPGDVIILADGEYAVVGTMNLDYRRLVHNFENGIWMYRCEAVKHVEEDILQVLADSKKIEPDMLKVGLLRRFIRAVVRIFSPML